MVPCYNEAARLPVDRLADFLRSHPRVQLLLVNDGSTDRTPALLQDLAARGGEQVQVIDLQPNGGKAQAVRRGLLQAIDSGAPVTGYWDADLATPLDAVDEMMQVLDRRPQVELVMGSRWRRLGSRIERTLGRHLVGRIFATGASMTLNLPVYDTQCGAKLLRVTEATRAALAEPFHSRWIFDVELIGRISDWHRRRGMADREDLFFEVPLPAWHDVHGSKLQWRDFVRSMLDLWRISRIYRGLR